MYNKLPILKVRNVKKFFKRNDHQDLLVLNNVNLELFEGEIVALLGQSGSGKSTLLRIIAGLIKPSTGEINYRGIKVNAPVDGVSMVFQSFAIMPWLTVLQNVELGLEAQGLPKNECRIKALQAIDIVGLDGFESAYPRELSGGMKQRVGFARAVVVNPDILLMDEPFSALDVLTADNLRSDLLDLWQSKKTNIKSILIVTHNISEAAALADRIVIFGSSPANIKAELIVDILHPRNEQTPKFRLLIDNIYTLMTTSTSSVNNYTYRYKATHLGYRLPNVQISEITGLLDMLIEPIYCDKKIDLPIVADELYLNIDDLFPITEALEILHFARVSKGDIQLNTAGKSFAEADILERKKIFAKHLLSYVPLASHIRRVLDERPEHVAPKFRFLNEIEDYLSENDAEDVLKIVIEWGRYAEIFAYDHNTGQLSLENP